MCLKTTTHPKLGQLHGLVERTDRKYSRSWVCYTDIHMPVFWGAFHKFWYSERGFSSQTKVPRLHKVGMFWANYHEKHPIWAKLGVFLYKMMVNGDKIGIAIVKMWKFGKHTGNDVELTRHKVMKKLSYYVILWYFSIILVCKKKQNKTNRKKILTDQPCLTTPHPTHL